VGRDRAIEAAHRTMSVNHVHGALSVFQLLYLHAVVGDISPFGWRR
jgi:hypothetical protein